MLGRVAVSLVYDAVSSISQCIPSSEIQVRAQGQYTLGLNDGYVPYVLERETGPKKDLHSTIQIQIQQRPTQPSRPKPHIPSPPSLLPPHIPHPPPPPPPQ